VGGKKHEEETETFAIARPRSAPSPGLRVTVIAGPKAGIAKDFHRTKLVIGRSPGADVCIDDRTVSAFHAEIFTVSGGIAVRDLESSNGTLFHGARFDRAVLPPGSVIHLGSSQVRLDHAKATLDAPVDAPEEATSFGALHGASPPMRRLFGMLARLAKTELSVLVHGPTGTGKELVARALHDASRRASGPFVVLDCTSIPASLAESVLFGHERGAFTGANERQPGVFEAAHGGTVFLDEIGELPTELQPKLLRVLEQRTVARVGSAQPRPIDVRVISATWRDLRAAINGNRFREDLYHRLAQANVELPPLDDRREDIPVLVKHILSRLPRDRECARTIDSEALAELRSRAYPGNVRELRNVVERAAWMALGSVITSADLAFERRLAGEKHRDETPAEPEGAIDPFKTAKRTMVDDFERAYLQKLFTRTQGNISRAAALAGIERVYVRKLFRKHGLRANDD
jgi:DNA-binding NtrC family response regulator